MLKKFRIGKKWAHLHNKAMAQKLTSGSAIDLKGLEVSPGVYRLESFTPNVDYCDSAREAWVWSISKNLETGIIMAALDGRYYQNAGFECLWLR